MHGFDVRLPVRGPDAAPPTGMDLGLNFRATVGSQTDAAYESVVLGNNFLGAYDGSIPTNASPYFYPSATIRANCGDPTIDAGWVGFETSDRDTDLPAATDRRTGGRVMIGNSQGFVDQPNILRVDVPNGVLMSITLLMRKITSRLRLGLYDGPYDLDVPANNTVIATYGEPYVVDGWIAADNTDLLTESAWIASADSGANDITWTFTRGQLTLIMPFDVSNTTTYLAHLRIRG